MIDDEFVVQPYAGPCAGLKDTKVVPLAKGFVGQRGEYRPGAVEIVVE